jgi:hypothetical protein
MVARLRPTVGFKGSLSPQSQDTYYRRTITALFVAIMNENETRRGTRQTTCPALEMAYKSKLMYITRGYTLMLLPALAMVLYF